MSKEIRGLEKEDWIAPSKRGLERVVKEGGSFYTLLFPKWILKHSNVNQLFYQGSSSIQVTVVKEKLKVKSWYRDSESKTSCLTKLRRKHILLQVPNAYHNQNQKIFEGQCMDVTVTVLVLRVWAVIFLSSRGGDQS